jgi:hypothetical protein
MHQVEFLPNLEKRHYFWFFLYFLPVFLSKYMKLQVEFGQWCMPDPGSNSTSLESQSGQFKAIKLPSGTHLKDCRIFAVDENFEYSHLRRSTVQFHNERTHSFQYRYRRYRCRFSTGGNCSRGKNSLEQPLESVIFLHSLKHGI